MKTCPGIGCGNRPISAFGKNRRMPDGLQHKCRECTNLYQREMRRRSEIERKANLRRIQRLREARAALPSGGC